MSVSIWRLLAEFLRHPFIMSFLFKIRRLGILTARGTVGPWKLMKIVLQRNFYPSHFDIQIHVSSTMYRVITLSRVCYFGRRGSSFRTTCR